MHTMQNTKKGFTLIELLIVITIIGILAAALLPNILGAPAKARDAARAADLNSLVASIEAMNADGTPYPSGDLCVNAANFSGLTAYSSGGVIPSDPSGQDTDYSATDCAAGEYFYCEVTASANQNYAVVALLEGGGGNDDDSNDVCANGSADLNGSGNFQVVIQ